MNQFNKRVRTNTGNIFNINYESTVENNNTGGGGGGGGGGASVVVVNNLVTDDPDAALSAAQGVVLKNITDNNTSAIDQITDAINTLDAGLTTLTTQVGINTTSVALLTTDVNILNSRVDQGVNTTSSPVFANAVVGGVNLNTRLAADQSDILTLQSQVGTNSTSITSLTTDVNILNSRVNQSVNTTSSPVFANVVSGGVNVNTRLAADQADILTLQTDVMNLDNSTYNNTTRITSLESAMSTVDGEITSLTTDVNILNSRVNQGVNTTSSPSFANAVVGGVNLNTRLAADQTDILSLQSSVGTLNTTTSSNTSRISALETTSASHTTSINNLQNSVNSNTTNITSLQSTVNSLTNSDLKTQIYGVYSFSVIKDGSGNVIFQTFTQRGTTLFTNPSVGGVVASGIPIYFSNNGSFEWGTNMEIIPTLMYYTNNIGGSGVAYTPGVVLIQEDNQTFSIRPYQGTTISDWQTTLSNNSGIGFRFILQRIQF